MFIIVKITVSVQDKSIIRLHFSLLFDLMTFWNINLFESEFVIILLPHLCMTVLPTQIHIYLNVIFHKYTLPHLCMTVLPTQIHIYLNVIFHKYTLPHLCMTVLPTQIHIYLNVIFHKYTYWYMHIAWRLRGMLPAHKCQDMNRLFMRYMYFIHWSLFDNLIKSLKAGL